MSELQLVEQHDGRAVTTSLIVAEVFGKGHDNVLKSVRNLLSDLPDGGLVNFNESFYVNDQNKQQPMYEITRDGFTLLAMGFTGKQALQFKLSYIDAFNKAEQIIKSSLPASFSEALKLAYEQQLQIEQAAALVIELKQVNAVMQPKADFFDAVTESKQAVGLDVVAKILDLGIGRNNLFEFLRGAQVLERNNQPYQKFVDAGYFRVIEQKWQGKDGSTNISFKTVVYQKGVDFIRKKLIEAGYGSGRWLAA